MPATYTVQDAGQPSIGHKLNLTFEELDSIVTQGKELGIYFYMMTGGEAAGS